MVEIGPRGEGLYGLGYAGDTFNTAWAARCMLPSSFEVRYVTAVGRDWPSEAMVAFAQRNGIDTSHVSRSETRTLGLYAIKLDRGERSFVYWRHNSAATRLADDSVFLRSAFQDASMIFFSGITLAILTPKGRRNFLAALRNARRNGALICFDPNYRARLWFSEQEARETFCATAALVDIATPTFSDEAELFGDQSPDETAQRMKHYGIAEVVVKNGPFPALARIGRERLEVPAKTVARIVDTTGAGDAFSGTYLAARLRQFEPAQAIAMAHEAAAVAVATQGALVPATVLSF